MRRAARRTGSPASSTPCRSRHSESWSTRKAWKDHWRRQKHDSPGKGPPVNSSGHLFFAFLSLVRQQLNHEPFAILKATKNAIALA